ncbi:glycoside hydrolase family 43 protein [Flavobacteriaceae bacterium SZ-1-7]|uniref:glycoside hydrolase family 43 protein n=1 Tax=Tamlana sedimenti TaxID=3134126 RepID=UPI003120918C
MNNGINYQFTKIFDRSVIGVSILFTLSISLTSWAQLRLDSFKPGELWPDTDGKHINAHGGGFLYSNGTYYWYGEHKGKESSAQVGVRVYSSKDLYNWKNEGVALSVSHDSNSEIVPGCVIERPKVIFNEKTNTYVMWFHLELKGQGYAAAKTAVATSNNPVGPFKFLKSFRPNAGYWPVGFQKELKNKTYGKEYEKWWTPVWKQGLDEGMFVNRDLEKGQMSRDMTLYVDTDGKAYHIHASEENQTLHISELTDDFLDFTDRWARILPGGQNEAPAIFKEGKYYYLITSGLTGWEPNAARSFRATSIWGPWIALGNPAIGIESEVTFRSQSTYVLPVFGKPSAYIFMADRWNPKNHIDGRYIWLPITLTDDNRLIIEWMDEWNLDWFNKI